MAFVADKWKDGEAGGTPITAAELNRIEAAGVAASAAPAWGDVTGKPSTFAPATHTHTVANVTGLQAAIDGKASVDDLSALAARVEALETPEV